MSDNLHGLMSTQNNFSNNGISNIFPMQPYRSPLNHDNRKRNREINDNYSSLSPNINNKLKRQRQKLSLNHENNNKEKNNYSDDDYLPPTKNNQRINNKTNNNNNTSYSSSDSSDSNTDVVGYRKLNWRKKQVATPKFIIIDNENNNNENKFKFEQNNYNEIEISEPPKLKASASTIDMYGIVGDKLEDTSNKAYFYRHYRAEAREKLFYEELFESRLKQQQILEEKEKRRKKKQKRKRKSKKNGADDDIIICDNIITEIDINNNNNNSNNNDNNNDNDIQDIDINNDDNNNIFHDLTLPKLPSGPWSYKLGAEYDKRPNVPKIVTNTPKFNYYIPFEKLKQKQFIIDLKERKKLDNWWKMPQNLIRRTDYGNMGNVKIKINSNNNTNNTTNNNNNINNNNNNNKKDEIKQKKELIELYQKLKQVEKQKQNKHITKKDDDKKTRKKKHKHKKKDKHREKKHGKNKNTFGPVDVRLLLK